MRALRPDRSELRVVVGLLGRMFEATAGLHLPALVVAVAAGEARDGSALLLSAALAMLAGRAAGRLRRDDDELRWATGMVVVAATWLLVPVFVALPLWLSGHAVAPVDAYFDAMSGFTTSGLSLLQDLDHLGAGMQVLRHLTHFAGGQGIVIVVLTVLARGAGGASTLLVGEGRDERVVPNVLRTARLIYLIAGAWAVVGSLALVLALLGTGFTPWRAVLHGTTLFMAAFDTGGFSIMSTSAAYYHSAAVEAVLVVLMVAGALSFPLHWLLWQRRVGDATRSLDLRTFATTTALLGTLLVVGLAVHGTYADVGALTRKGVFTAVSAATGTGFTVVASSTWATWGQLGPAVVVALMGIGAMAGSTAGGVKTLRVGLLAKSVLADLRRSLSPPSQVVAATHRSLRRTSIVDDAQARAAFVVTLLFLGCYLLGAMVGVYEGATIEAALFESVSASANVGLTIGVLVPDASLLLKVVAVAQMWLGRLEFLAAFALVGWVAQLGAAGATRVRARLA